MRLYYSNIIVMIQGTDFIIQISTIMGFTGDIYSDEDTGTFIFNLQTNEHAVD